MKNRLAHPALTPGDPGDIERAAAKIRVRGARYAEARERMTNR
ncbi:MAG: hypothetical protein WKF63_11385 [Thermomicrobiales bacterium]